MTRLITLVAVLGAAASLTLGATAATAADEPSLVDGVAAQLGVSPERLRAAFKSALTARVDSAIAAGKLTPEQGAKLKARIAEAKGLGVGARKGFGKKARALKQRLMARGKTLGAAADYLGLTRAELRTELQEGRSLAEIAGSQGKSKAGLVAALTKEANERIANALADGKLTQTRADALKERIAERVERLVERQREAKTS